MKEAWTPGVILAINLNELGVIAPNETVHLDKPPFQRKIVEEMGNYEM